MNWEERFKHHTTSVAFSLSLSKAQVTLLLCIDEECVYFREYFRRVRGLHDTLLMSINALDRRGLVYYDPMASENDFCTERLVAEKSPVLKLTPAGVHVKALVEIAITELIGEEGKA